jgi:hypothetical protein
LDPLGRDLCFIQGGVVPGHPRSGYRELAETPGHAPGGSGHPALYIEISDLSSDLALTRKL